MYGSAKSGAASPTFTDGGGGGAAARAAWPSACAGRRESES